MSHYPRPDRVAGQGEKENFNLAQRDKALNSDLDVNNSFAANFFLCLLNPLPPEAMEEWTCLA